MRFTLTKRLEKLEEMNDPTTPEPLSVLVRDDIIRPDGTKIGEVRKLYVDGHCITNESSWENT